MHFIEIALLPHRETDNVLVQHGKSVLEEKYKKSHLEVLESNRKSRSPLENDGKSTKSPVLFYHGMTLYLSHLIFIEPYYSLQ